MMIHELPSPRDAMREAVDAAQRGDHASGHLWLGIARELRLGRQRPPAMNEWDDAAGMPAPCQPIGCDAGRHLSGCYFADLDTDGDLPAMPMPSGEPAAQRFERVPITEEDDQLRNLTPLVRQAEAATAVIRMGGQPEDPTAAIEHPPCGHCGHLIGWRLDGGTPLWVHVLTDRDVCPVSTPGQAKTYATPKLDARG